MITLCALVAGGCGQATGGTNTGSTAEGAATAQIAGSAEDGTVAADASLDLRWALSQADALGMSEVTITPLWAGANRGPVRDDDWTRIPVMAEVVRPLGLDADGVDTDGVDTYGVDTDGAAAAEGVLPSGTYDRVFVAATDVRARQATGDWVSLVNHIEPIARGFHAGSGEHETVTIELVIRPPSSTGDGRNEIFAKHARIAGHHAEPSD